MAKNSKLVFESQKIKRASRKMLRKVQDSSASTWKLTKKGLSTSREWLVENWEKASTKSKQTFTDAKAWSDETLREFRAYIESDDFEKDLDSLAEKLGITDPRFNNFDKNRNRRVRSKISFLVEHTKAEVLSAAGKGAAVGALTGNPKFVALASAAFGGARGALIAIACYEVFVERNAMEPAPAQ